MNWLDLVIIISLIIFSLEGLGRSFIAESFNFVSFLLGLFWSLRFYNLAASQIEQNFRLPHSIDNILGFVLIWFLVESIFFLTFHLAFKPNNFWRKIDHFLIHLSPAPAFLRGLVFIAIVLVVIGTFPIQPQLKQAVSDSKLGTLLLSQTVNLEGPLKNVFGGIANDSLAFLTVKPESNERVNLGFTTRNFQHRPDLESPMIDLVNQERSLRGIAALTFNAKLQQIAREHSADMFERGYFSHYSPENDTVANRAQKAGIDYLVIGENLAYAPNLQLAHNGLMNSPGHRANILSTDYHQIGIGIEDGGVYGLMITQVFTN